MQGTKEPVIVEQAVHGYKEGHQLLASSMKFEIDTARQILFRSDISGPYIKAGFETYLTGYPLPEEKKYVLARTWYAFEMPRPGCVWTHSLILDNSDLVRVASLPNLEELFQRPNQKHGFEQYRKQLQVFDAESKSEELETHYNLIRVIQYILYGEQQHIVIVDDAPGPLDQVVTHLWNQQWGELRSVFSFCTGLLSTKWIKNEPFDIQIIPSSRLSSFKREMATASFLRNRTESATKVPGWVSLSASSLLEGRNSPFQQFIWEFGNEFGMDLGAFEDLAILYESLSQFDAQGSVRPIVDLVAKRFPGQRGSYLKKALFCPNEAPGMPSIDEGRILHALLETNHSSAYDPESLNIRRATSSVYQTMPDYALSMACEVLGKRTNRLRKEFLSTLAPELSVPHLYHVAAGDISNLNKLVKISPSFLTKTRFWQMYFSEDFETVQQIIKNGQLSLAIQREMLSAMLSAERLDFALQMSDKLGDSAVPVMLDFIDKVHAASKSDEIIVQRLLFARTEIILDWLKSREPHRDTLAVLSEVLDPRSVAVGAAAFDHWLRFSSALGEIDERKLTSSSCFSLALGFYNYAERGGELVQNSFQTVYDMAERNQLGERWGMLEGLAPTISWFGSWDLCERLRYALVHHFVVYAWDVDYFLHAIKRPKTWKQVARDCKEFYEGRLLFERIALEAKNRHIELRHEQEKTLSSYL